MSKEQQQLESDLRSALFRYRNLSTAADFRFRPASGDDGKDGTGAGALGFTGSSAA